MTKFQRRRRGLIATIVVLSIVLAGLCGVVYAKYFKNDTVSGQITIHADLGTIILQEHKAERKLDGSYQLTEAVVTANTYTLLPGLDVPKDPHVLVDKANDIPVYIYVEVVDMSASIANITYTPKSGWTNLGITGPKGGNVYCYHEVIKDDITESAPLFFLTDNTIYVSQYLDETYINPCLAFYAYMYQTIPGKTQTEVFQQLSSTP